jgi:hypothetical protein
MSPSEQDLQQIPFPYNLGIRISYEQYNNGVGGGVAAGWAQSLTGRASLLMWVQADGPPSSLLLQLVAIPNPSGKVVWGGVS